MKRDLDALQSRVHDVLVVGGGIAGAWALYEAATRGLEAALLEADDFGQATSWSSLKTAHGGLRHLQRLDIVGFRESTRERRALLRVAPEIVRPLTFAVRVDGLIDRLKYSLGGVFNELLSLDGNEGVSGDRRLAASRVLPPAAARVLSPEAFAGASAFTWQDAQIVYTERLLMALLHDASALGAFAANHCRVDGLSRQGDRFAVTVSTREGLALKIEARSIVNAAGAAVAALAGLAGDPIDAPTWLRGVNLVLEGSLSPQGEAIGSRDGSGRFLFLVPWLDRTLLGTEYDDGERPVERLVDDLLESARQAFPWADLSSGRIQAIHDGQVPSRAGEPVYRSRVLGRRGSSIATIVSAKYTTARSTAEKAIEKVAADISRTLSPSVSATRTLTCARPLAGSLADRLRAAKEDEMAADDAEALRGRLVEGARGHRGSAAGRSREE